MTVIYELLLDEAHKKGIQVFERIQFESNSKGLIKGNKIALNSNLTTDKERSCILAEEIAHSDVNVGNILDLKMAENRKQEYKARKLAFDRLIGLKGLVNAFDKGCRNLYEMADCLDVTEDFLKDAIEFYNNKYGVRVTIDNHIIYFEPYLHIGKIY